MDDVATAYVTIRFYSDERKKVLIVPTEYVQNFNADHESLNKPYFIKRYDGDSKFHYSPGEVLSSVGKY